MKKKDGLKDLSKEEKIEWKDITSYSQADKIRTPTSFRVTYGNISITLTCNHIDYKGQWVFFCNAVGFDAKLLKKSKTLEEAKVESLEIINDKISCLLEDVKILSKSCVVDLPKPSLADLLKPSLDDLLHQKEWAKQSCPYGHFDREGDFDCELNTKLDCDDCKFGLGRKNPFAKRNQ